MAVGDSEFSIIDEVFAPLSDRADGALRLKDDVAQLPASEYIVSKDILVAGVHFREKDALDLVARKLLRANLSDLAAKGARPAGYFLGCTWPKEIKRSDVELFAQGLKEDQDAFRIGLFGGDTTRHRKAKMPLVLSATIFGTPPRQGIVTRAGAAAGDDLYVTGTIGDAGLGLRALDRKMKMSTEHKELLTTRYLLPEPRLTIGSALSGLASATIDVSDGLIADCVHLIAASGPLLRAQLFAQSIPLSAPAAAWLENQDSTDRAFEELVTAGDDYEILFTAPQSMRRSVEMAANVAKTPVARIGNIEAGENSVTLLNADGETIDISQSGYNHFA